MTAGKLQDLESFTDWLGQFIYVGDHVLVIASVGDSPGIYSGIVEEIGMFSTYGNHELIKAKVKPSGKYNRYQHHSWPYEQDPLTGKNVRVGFPRANWILATNLTRFHGKVLDYGERVELE